MTNVKHLAKYHAFDDVPLNYDEAYSLGKYALEGCSGNARAQIESIALLCALHDKTTYSWQLSDKEEPNHLCDLPKNAAEQIAGVCAAIFEHDIAVSGSGFLNPDVEYAMDNCGMGGDFTPTANLSTLAAFIAAAAGIPMLKHGSPANTDEGKYGSSDFLSEICGINTYASKERIEECLKKHNFAFTEALDTRYKRIHLQTHKIARLPHMNDIIGPITNPLNPQLLKKRVLGVNHLIAPRIVAEAYLILNEKKITNIEHALFVRGFVDKERLRGMDEVSLCEGGTQVAELKNGKVMEYDLFAHDFGSRVISVRSVSPIGNKGEYSLKLLMRKIKGEPLKLVLANAAILFYLAERSGDFKECYDMAEQVFESGKAYEIMLAVREMLSKNE